MKLENINKISRGLLRIHTNYSRVFIGDDNNRCYFFILVIVGNIKNFKRAAQCFYHIAKRNVIILWK